MSNQKPYGSDSETESQQNDAIETPLVKNKESGSEYLQNDANINCAGAENMPRYTTETLCPKSELGLNVADLTDTTANLEIDASQLNPIMSMESGDGKIPIGASGSEISPDYIKVIPTFSKKSETANVQVVASCSESNIGRASKMAQEVSAPVEQIEKKSKRKVGDLVCLPTGGEDITLEKNEGVLKVITKEGTGLDSPILLDRVEMRYEFYILVEGIIIKEPQTNKLNLDEYIVGKGNIFEHGINGFDLAILSMKQGESATFIIRPSYAFALQCPHPDDPPPNALLVLEMELHSWKSTFEDLSPSKDNSILRRVMSKGEGSTFPSVGSKVKIQLVGCYRDRIFDNRVQEFKLGEGPKADIPEGIEQALYKFRFNETSMIYLKGIYGSTADMEGHGSENSCHRYYQVTLLSFEKVKQVWEMNSDEKLKRAIESREKGITYTKADNFRVAVKYFKWIVTCLENEPGADPETVESRNNLLLSGYLNISLCFLKLGNYKNTIIFCDKALTMDPHNEKALFRRGLAKMGNKDFKEAIKDFNQVVTEYPNNGAAKINIERCREQIKRENKEDQAIYHNMFDLFKKQDLEKRKNMRTETGVWQDENGEASEHHSASGTTERLIEENILLLNGNIPGLSSNVGGNL